jgi:ABC-type cobalamin/Fe3+-siderophores transport system ATPase subunit
MENSSAGPGQLNLHYNSSMILKGVQFFDYACFTQQFVSLGPGLNLLVGKNNAGKTALLRGIAALAELPMYSWPQPTEERFKFINSLAAYTRNDNPEPHYRIEIIFQMEQDDFIPIKVDSEFWRRLAQQGSVLSAYKFWFLPIRARDQIVFESCELRIPGYPQMPILVSDEQGFHTLSYDLPQPGGQLPPVIIKNTVHQGGMIITGLDRKNCYVPVPAIEGFFDGFAPFSLARYVSPHRVVTSWIDIQTADSLPDTADNLAVFLQTLHGRDRKAFQKIENLVVSIFPEFSAVNPASERNQVRITLCRHDVNKNIPLTHCGTGVEQVLAIATFAVTAKPGAVMLIDEPHSFLHPTAERQLIDFLKNDHEHRFVVSTHSAVLMNAVSAERIRYVEAPGQGFSNHDREARVGQILLDLGYRNSDILFSDSLIIVEGRTDKSIFAILLALTGISVEHLARVGFPTLQGVPERLRDLQTAILKYEKLIDALSQRGMPRVYLLDGDRSQDDVGVLSAMRNAESEVPIPVKFLPRTEIENYLLAPSAIAPALRQEAELLGADIEITDDAITTRLGELLNADQTDRQLFPRGKRNDPAKDVKGSVLLQRLYASFGNLVYDKEHSGTLIAHHLRLQDQPCLKEIRDLVSELFPE